MLTPLQKKQQRPLPYDPDDLNRTKEACDLHYQFYEKRNRAITTAESQKNSYDGFMLENQFYAELANNAVEALSAFTDVRTSMPSINRSRAHCIFSIDTSKVERPYIQFIRFHERTTGEKIYKFPNPINRQSTFAGDSDITKEYHSHQKSTAVSPPHSRHSAKNISWYCNR